jgi:hypothetical protein
MSTSKKEVKSLQRSQPDMLDMIDQANVDIDFVESVLDLLCAVGEGKRLETIRHRTIICLCSESKIRMDAIKMFVRSISHCDDSRPETAGKDRIAEEIAVYGRHIEGKPRWLLQETMMFSGFPDTEPMIIHNSRDCL